MTQAWRLTPWVHAMTAFSGEGARLHGGRWNPPGDPAVYLASTIALAALEYLTGVDVDLAPERLVVIPAEWDTDLPVEVVASRHLPRGWRAYPNPQSTRDLGHAWLQSSRTAVLSVPSAIVPQERLYVVNPRHPRFRDIRIGRPQPFTLDPRLWT